MSISTKLSSLSNSVVLSGKEMEPILGDAQDPFSVGRIVLPVFDAIKKLYPDGIRSIAGSYITNHLVAPVYSVVNDLDVKLIFVDPSDDKYEFFHRIEAVVKNVFKGLGIECKYSDYTYKGPKFSFGLCKVLRPGRLPVEISINIVNDPNVRLHVMNLDSIYVQEEGGEFKLRSKEVQEGEDINPLLESIKNRTITFSTPDSAFSHVEWYRYILAITDGCIELASDARAYMFQKGSEVGRKQLPLGISKWVNEKREEILNYSLFAACNSLLNCPAESPLFLDFVKELNGQIQAASEEKIQNTWISFFKKAKIKPDNLPFLLKLFLPFFADEIHVKKHLSQVQAQCQFKSGEHFLYIPIPILSEEKSRVHFHDPKGEVYLPEALDGAAISIPLMRSVFQKKISKEVIAKEKEVEQKVKEAITFGDFSLAVTKMLLSQDLLLEEIEALLPYSDITLFSGEERIALISRIFMMCGKLRSSEFLSKFSPLFSKMIPSSFEKGESEFFCEVLKQILITASEDLNHLSAASWKWLNGVLSSHVQSSKHWKTFAIRFVLESSIQKNEYKAQILQIFMQALGPFSFADFPKLFPDEKTKGLYFLKASILLRSIDPEQSFEYLLKALDFDLKVNFEELQSRSFQELDPLDFNDSLKKLSAPSDLAKKMRLLEFQGSLVGYFKIAPFCRELFSKTPQDKQSEVDAFCLRIANLALENSGFILGGKESHELGLVRLFAEAFEGTKAKIAWTMYKDFAGIPLVASLIESKYFAAFNSRESLIAGTKEVDRQKYLTAFMSRLKSQEPCDLKLLVPFLPLLGIKKGDLASLLANRFQRDPESVCFLVESEFASFPNFISELFESFQQQSDELAVHRFALMLSSSSVGKEMRLLAFESFIQNLDRLIQKHPKEAVAIGKAYLSTATDDERASFAFACTAISPVFYSTIKELFAFSIPSDGSLKDSFEKQKWTKESIQKGFYLLKQLEKKSENQFVAYVEAVLKNLSHVKENRPLIQELGVYFNESSKSVFAFFAKEQIYLPLKQSIERSSYIAFLMSPTLFPVVKENHQRLYIAFVEFVLNHVKSVEKISGKEASSLLKFLSEPFSFQCPIEDAQELKINKIEAAVNCLYSLDKKAKVDVDWILADLAECLNHPRCLELSKHLIGDAIGAQDLVLCSIIPRLNSSFDEEEVLDILHLHVQFLSDPSFLGPLANYVIEMHARFPFSSKLFEVSQRVIEQAFIKGEREVVLELVAKVHTDRLEKAIDQQLDLEVVKEVAFYWKGRDLLFPYIEENLVKSMTYLLMRVQKDPSCLDLFKDKSIASPELSLSVCFLLKSYIEANLPEELTVKHLAYHLKKIRSLSLEAEDYAIFEVFSDSLLEKLLLSAKSMKSEESDFFWIANKDLSNCFKVLVEFFLRRSEERDLLRVKEIVEQVHVRRINYPDVSSSILGDLEAYALYLENVLLNDREDVGKGLNCVVLGRSLVDVLRYCSREDESRSKTVGARLLRVMVSLCRKGNEGFDGFLFAMASLDMISIMPECIKGMTLETVDSLIQFAFRSPWPPEKFPVYIKALIQAAKILSGDRKFRVSARFTIQSFEKALDQVKTLKSILTHDQKDGIAFLAKIMAQEFSRSALLEYGILLRDLLAVVQSVSPGFGSELVREVKREYPCLGAYLPNI